MFNFERSGRLGSRQFLAALASIAVLACLGCGVSEYDKLVDRGVMRIRSEAKFQGLYAPAQIPGTNLTLRVPVIFPNSYKPESSHPDDGDKINPERMFPPGMASDTVKITYEGMAKVNDEKLPYYLYVSVNDVKPGEVDKMAERLLEGVRLGIPDAPKEWEAIDAATPEGKFIHWRKLRVTVEMPFFVKKSDGQLEKRKMPGVVELWLHDTGNQLVVLGWRAPVEIEGPQTGEYNVFNGVALPTDNAKPDLTKWPVLTAGTLTETAAATP